VFILGRIEIILFSLYFDVELKFTNSVKENDEGGEFNYYLL
jgi:hypothetical protein